MKAPTKLAVAIALCLCIMYACSVNAAGVGGSTAGYMYIIEYDFSITQTPIDKKGMGTTKVLVEKDNGGLYKQSIAVGPESVYWMAAPELPMGWQDYCIYEYSMQTGRIAILACDLVEGEFNWPHNLYFSDEMNTLYWTAISDDPIAADSTLYYLNSTGDIESLIKRQPFWDPSGLVVTKDNHGDAVIAENTVGPVDDPLVWGQMGVYTWPYKQEASQTFYTSFQPYNEDFKTEFYFYFPGPMDIAYVDYNSGRNSTELYYVTIYEGPNIKETPMFQISKVDLFSPVDNIRPVPRVVLDWTTGIPDTISVDPINQQLFVSFYLYSLQSPEARVSAIGKVDVSGNLPSTMQVISKESSLMYALENMRIRAL